VGTEARRVAQVSLARRATHLKRDITFLGEGGQSGRRSLARERVVRSICLARGLVVLPGIRTLVHRLADPSPLVVSSVGCWRLNTVPPVDENPEFTTCRRGPGSFISARLTTHPVAWRSCSGHSTRAR
jgi:hypothetical protein